MEFCQGADSMKWIMIGVLVLGLSGCARGGGGAVEGGEGSAEPAPEPSVIRTSAPAQSSLPKQLCAFLEDEVPRLKERGSGLTALAGFAADYAGWISEDASRLLEVASDLDAITTTSCPKIRSQVLELLDRESLAQALGG
jgi:hypothetical protein